MTAKYIQMVERYGRTEQQVDVATFARDLAKALGGALLPATEDATSNRAIKIGPDVLAVRSNHYASKGRVTVSISAPDVKWDDRNTYDKTHRTEDATVNPEGRTIERIAADIKRRVIDASLPALALQRAHAAQLAQGRADIVARAADLKAALPGLDIRVNEKERRAGIFNGASSHYLSGTLNADGSISLDRIGSMSTAKFLKIVAVLNDK
jgi:hypothetical protein